MGNIFTKDKVKQGMEQAKVLAIDKIKGRVSLYMKNGLITSGTYIYDINDLVVGATVLVARIDDSFIIMNKISNAPRENKSYSLIHGDFFEPRTIRKTYLLLTFQGEDGATSWVDNGQGLIPSPLYDGYQEIDTVTGYIGASSLLVKPNHDVEGTIYSVPNVDGDNFEYIVVFKYNDFGVSPEQLFPMNLYDDYGDTDIRLRIIDEEGWIYAANSAGYVFGEVDVEESVGSISINQWNVFRFKVFENKAYFYVNDILFGERAFSGSFVANGAWWGNWSSGGNMWLGYVKLYTPD